MGPRRPMSAVNPSSYCPLWLESSSSPVWVSVNVVDPYPLLSLVVCTLLVVPLCAFTCTLQWAGCHELFTRRKGVDRAETLARLVDFMLR